MVAAQLDTRARLPAGEPAGYAGYGAERHGVRIFKYLLVLILRAMKSTLR